jgi:hypothetical protein
VITKTETAYQSEFLAAPVGLQRGFDEFPVMQREHETFTRWYLAIGSIASVVGRA